MYVRTYVHTYIHTYVCTYIYTYRHTYIRTYVCTDICTYVCTCGTVCRQCTWNIRTYWACIWLNTDVCRLHQLHPCPLKLNVGDTVVDHLHRTHIRIHTVCMYVFISVLRPITLLWGSEVLNPLQSGPEFTPWDLGVLILKEMWWVKVLRCRHLFLCFFGHSLISSNFLWKFNILV